MKIESRGVAPKGGGEVVLSVPVVKDCLKAMTWIDEGMVKRIRGVSFSTRVSVQFENTMIHAARGIFNPLLPDVHIFTDHKAGALAGKSPGYGISLVAETTTGCFISCDSAVSYARGDEGDMDDEEKREPVPPEEMGEQIASLLLEEIKQGGVVDSVRRGVVLVGVGSWDVAREGCRWEMDATGLLQAHCNKVINSVFVRKGCYWGRVLLDGDSM